MAFVKSPDDISIELLQKNGPLEPIEPWVSMSNKVLGIGKTSEKKVLFLDIQTSGGSPKLHDIVEIAWAIGDSVSGFEPRALSSLFGMTIVCRQSHGNDRYCRGLER